MLRFETINAVAGAKDNDVRMAMAGNLIECSVKFLSENTTPDMLQAHEAEKPYLPTVTEFLEFAKKKFNVQ
ncbi:hypothetical protein HID58_072607 [Brassica napus]|uniref:Uncharacterized protein n=1 Tax=Brassica napus TaxID=3708 RepID=A0ABQ7Z554_BRANA|nr:hypothetical protein HID58_072607 [Brassica napus]